MVSEKVTTKTIQAFLAGVFLLVTLFFISRYIGDEIPATSVIGSYKLVFAAIFIGTSMGYYLGKATEEEGDPILFFLLGMLSTLSAGFVYMNKISTITVVLALSGVTVFLIQNSGLADNAREIEQYIERTKDVALAGLVILGFIQYGIPIIIRTLSWVRDRAVELSLWLNGYSERWAFAIFVVIVSLIALHLALKTVGRIIRAEKRR